MDSNDPPSHPTPAPRRTSHSQGCFKWLCITLIATMAIGGIVGWKAVQAFANMPGAAIDTVLGYFRSEQVLTTSFRESLISIIPTHGDILEVATLEMDETLTHYDMKTWAGNLLYLGTTVSEVRVPAVYRYHIRLNDPWVVTRRDHACIVIAPSLHASQPPAIRTDKMEKKSASGWLRFNAAENLAELEKSVTPTLEKRGESPARLDQVRDAARKAVAEFVQTWLLKQQQWTTEEVTSITVVFADEAVAKDSAALLRQSPALTLP